MNLFKLVGSIFIDNEKANDSISKTDEKAESLGNRFAESAKAAVEWGASIAAAAVGMATAAGAAIIQVADDTREYRSEMGKLDTAFESSKFTAETARETYKSLQSILGETDQSVEAANHLAKLCDTQEQLANWTNICTGVYGTFGASLPIEGLTEASNETAKTGALTGSLADALNWAGVNEEQFQAQLDACSTEQERQALITETLNGLYSDAAEKYRENNEEVIKANEAQEKLNEAMAMLGEMAEPIATAIKLFGASVIEKAVPAVKELTEKGEVLGAWFKNVRDYVSGKLEPVFLDLNDVFVALNETFEFVFQNLQKTFDVLWKKIDALWESIGKPVWDAVMETIQYVSDNWSDISATISTLFQTLWDVCKTAWATVGQPVWEAISFVVEEAAGLFAEYMPKIMVFFQNAVSGIKDTWENHLKPVFEIIGDFLNTVLKPAFEFVFDAVIRPLVENVFGFIVDLWNGTLKPVFDGICDFLTGTFTGNWELAFQGILDIVTGILEGIETAFNSCIESVKDVVNKGIEKVKGFFDFDWKLPKLELPHFKVSGSFSLDPPSVPSFGIEWYAKAMNNPVIMNSPTAFGINSLGQIMAGGERGSEVVSGTDTLMNMIAKAVASQNGAVADSVNDGFARLLALLIQYLPQFASMQVVVDTGAAIGALAPAMDEALGKLITAEERGI